MDFTQRLVAQVFGAVFLIVGLLGFVNNPVLGLFSVNTLHNLVHVVSGAALLGAAYYKNGSMVRNALITFGVVYLLVTLVGFFNLAGLNGLLAINGMDNWLHLVLGVALVGAAYGLKK